MHICQSGRGIVTSRSDGVRPDTGEVRARADSACAEERLRGEDGGRWHREKAAQGNWVHARGVWRLEDSVRQNASLLCSDDMTLPLAWTEELFAETVAAARLATPGRVAALPPVRGVGDPGSEEECQDESKGREG